MEPVQSQPDLVATLTAPEELDALEPYLERVGWLDPSLPVLGTRNEASLKAAVGPQISELYGVLLRSTPSYFVHRARLRPAMVNERLRRFTRWAKSRGTL